MAKKITDEQKMVLEMANAKIPEGMAWFYQEIKAIKVSETQIDEVVKAIDGRGICHLSDICNVLDWQKGRDTEKRNKLQKLSTEIGITHGSGSPAQMLFDAMVKARNVETKDPMILLMNNKEAKKSRKRAKLEKEAGIERKIRAPKNGDEKVAARKERARIRKEAAKLSISTAEYKAQMKKEVAA